MNAVIEKNSRHQNKKKLLLFFHSLSPELQQSILSFLGGIIDAIKHFKTYGPFSRLQYHCWGFPENQNPSVLGVFGLHGKPWWDQLNDTNDCSGGRYAFSNSTEQCSLLSMDIREICNLLEANVHAISKEFQQLERDKSAYCERLKTSSNSRGEWNAFYLMDEGLWNIANRSTCPVTFSLLQQLPVCESSFGYVYFSVLSPHTSIDPHCGATNTKLRIQLPLIFEDDSSGRNVADCFLIVNGDERPYRPGRAVVFDDSFTHSVRNSGDGERVVLLIDIWHPSLPPSAIAELSKEFTVNFTTNNETRPDEGHFTKFPVPTVRDPKRNYDYLLKCLLVGDCGVGKTSFLLRWAQDHFSSNHQANNGIDFKIRNCAVRNCVAKVMVWDTTAGPERFRTITSAYYRGAQVILVVCDVTMPARSFFQSIDTHLAHIRSVVSTSITAVVVGTKIDLVDSRRVSYEEARAYCSERGLQYFETSSKTGVGVDNVIFYSTKTHLIHHGVPPAAATTATASSATTSSSKPSRSRCVLS